MTVLYRNVGWAYWVCHVKEQKHSRSLIFRFIPFNISSFVLSFITEDGHITIWLWVELKIFYCPRTDMTRLRVTFYRPLLSFLICFVLSKNPILFYSQFRIYSTLNKANIILSYIPEYTLETHSNRLQNSSFVATFPNRELWYSSLGSKLGPCKVNPFHAD